MPRRISAEFAASMEVILIGKGKVDGRKSSVGLSTITYNYFIIVYNHIFQFSFTTSRVGVRKLFPFLGIPSLQFPLPLPPALFHLFPLL